MTDITGIAVSPSVDDLEALVNGVEGEALDDALWVDAEFYAIIAANFDDEPPEPPGRPTELPARWDRPGRPPRVGSRTDLTGRVVGSDEYHRQRSPPT